MDVEFGTHERADVAQLAERVLGKDEVTGSIPVIGSSLCHSGVVDYERRAALVQAEFGLTRRPGACELFWAVELV